MQAWEACALPLGDTRMKALSIIPNDIPDGITFFETSNLLTIIHQVFFCKKEVPRKTPYLSIRRLYQW